MSPYIFILLSLLFFSIGVFIDNFLTNRQFKDLKALLFYSNITNLLFIPLIWIFGMPKALPTAMIIPLIVVAAAQVMYLYPYFLALREADTSIVSALFNVGKIFVPVLAFFIVGERLSILQYAGFAIILFSSFMLTYNGGLKVNKAFVYMISTTIIIAIMSTVMKYALATIDWITLITWTAVISTIMTLIVGSLFFRKEIAKSRKNYFRSFWQFVANEFTTFVAMSCVTYAIVTLPVTIAQGLLAAQPVMMIILTYILIRFFPKYFKEDMQWKSILKKSVFFILIIVGIVMSVR